MRKICRNRKTRELDDLIGSAQPKIASILDKALERREVTIEECKSLFDCSSPAHAGERAAIFGVANEIRKKVNGDSVSFVVNRNINFTNICYMGCKFCGFAKRREDPDAEWLSIDQVVGRANEAHARGASEICIQGGLHPKLPKQYYRDLVLALKNAIPSIHIHAFSPFEIWYGSKKTKMNFHEYLVDLKECGLGSIPGTAAEIFDQEVRKQLTQDKLSSETWIEIVRTAHQVGLQSSATIMYGHVDSPAHWATHLSTLREIQKETQGFTELVPLSFVHDDSPLYRNDPLNVRPGPTAIESELMHAVARIFLSGFIDNIQVSWTKLGPKVARRMLSIGCNDLGGTLMNESISRAAGAKNGQEITPMEMCKIIRSSGRVPQQRNTLYQLINDYENMDPPEMPPLVARDDADPLAFLEMFPEIQK